MLGYSFLALVSQNTIGTIINFLMGSLKDYLSIFLGIAVLIIIIITNTS